MQRFASSCDRQKRTAARRLLTGSDARTSYRFACVVTARRAPMHIVLGATGHVGSAISHLLERGVLRLGRVPSCSIRQPIHRQLRRRGTCRCGVQCGIHPRRSRRLGAGTGRGTVHIRRASRRRAGRPLGAARARRRAAGQPIPAAGIRVAYCMSTSGATASAMRCRRTPHRRPRAAGSDRQPLRAGRDHFIAIPVRHVELRTSPSGCVG